MAQFNHQPFEDWIFSRDTISREEQLALQEHIHQCATCQRLSGTMQEIEIGLKAAPMISPAEGFSTRWQARLAENRAWRQKRQTMFFFIFSICAAAVLTLLFVILLWPVIRMPYPYLLALAYEFASIYSIMNTFTSAGITLGRTIYSVVPPTMWISLVIAMIGMVAIWAIALRKFVYLRRVVI